MEGVGLGHSQQVTGGWLWDRGNNKRRGCPGRCPCLLLHPPPHDTGWQSPQTTAMLGSHTFPQGQAAAADHSWLGGAGGAEAGSKNKFQIGSNGEGAGAALVNKIPYGGGGGGSAPGPPTPTPDHPASIPTTGSGVIARIYN